MIQDAIYMHTELTDQMDIPIEEIIEHLESIDRKLDQLLDSQTERIFLLYHNF